MEAPQARLSSKVELFLSARKLRKADLLSKSDPFVIVYQAVPRPVAVGNPQVQFVWQQLGQSEVVKDNHDPSWTKQFVLDYAFEEAQPLKFVLFDYDDSQRHDPLGECEVPLGRVMAARGQTLTVPLSGNGAGRGSVLTIRGCEIATNVNDELRLVMRCAKLDRKDLFGSSDPFVVLNRIRPDGGRMRVWTGPVIKNNLNPVWAEQRISMQALCNGDGNMPLELQVYDWDSDGGHDLIGNATTTLNELVSLPSSKKQLTLVNPKKQSRLGYKNSGTFSVDRAAVVHVPSLLDYVKGGLQMNLVVAIDYTGSNGDPRTPASLHSLTNPSRPNEYLSALTAVGQILLEYDSDKQVPLYGFGGAINGATRHCFALTFNDAQPEVPGMDGLVGAYRNSFNYVGLSGPTYFEQVIRTAHEAAQADASSGELKYTVLLLLTDGQCNDIDNTTRAIIDASTSPLSIVIVGVGGADFSAMEFLDSDGELLSQSGRTAARDIVQFVPFRKFAAAGALASTRLAAEVLAEIPSQVVGHFMARGIPPPPPLQAVPVQLDGPEASSRDLNALANGSGNGGSPASSSSSSAPPASGGAGFAQSQAAYMTGPYVHPGPTPTSTYQQAQQQAQGFGPLAYGGQMQQPQGMMPIAQAVPIYGQHQPQPGMQYQQQQAAQPYGAAPQPQAYSSANV